MHESIVRLNQREKRKEEEKAGKKIEENSRKRAETREKTNKVKKVAVQMANCRAESQ